MTSLAKTLRLASLGPVPSTSNAAGVALGACADAEGLAKLALAHRMAPWLAAAIATDPELANDPRFAPVRQAAAAQTLQTLQLYAEMVRVLQILNQAEIPVVVLKGPVIADTYYPDAALRPYGDIDLLIHEANLDSVTGMLTARGYRERNQDSDAHRLHDCHGIFQRIFMHDETGAIIEVHCDHLQIGLEPVSMDTIWERATDVRFGRSRARALELHDLFVQLCVHLHRHGFERLIWFKDLDLILRAGFLDWGTVEQKARQQDCLNSVSYTLFLLTRVLATPLPREAQALVAQQGSTSRLLHRLVWPSAAVTSLTPRRQWRLRRVVQFAPETGIIRGGLPSFLLMGRRRDRLRVLRATRRTS